MAGSSSVRPNRADFNMGTYVSLVPLTEGGRINLDDGTLDEGVCPD